MNKDQLKLYLVTDRRMIGERSLEDIVVDAVRGGVSMVQLREKDTDTRDFLQIANGLLSVLSPLGIPLIINDRVDIALACGADGVHLGQSDMPYEDARRLLGDGRIIGLSAENIAQVESANSLDVDYIGISPVFSTRTKTDTMQPFGLDGLRSAAGISKHPLVAIGGINSSNASAVMRSGATGIAVVSAIMGSASPYEAAKELREIC